MHRAKVSRFSEQRSDAYATIHCVTSFALQALFQSADESGDGEIDKGEFLRVMGCAPPVVHKYELASLNIQTGVAVSLNS